MQTSFTQKLLIALLSLTPLIIFSDDADLPATSATASTVTNAPAPLFIVHFTIGKNWDPNKPAKDQKYFAQHSENLRALRTGNKLVLGARYADKGMIILRAADEVEARKLIEQDSTVVHHVFDFTLHPFQPFYDGCIESK